MAVTDQTWEGDFSSNPAFDRAHARRHGTSFEFFCRTAAWYERERHAVNFRIFGIEVALLIGGVVHAAQGATHDLFAKQLSTEGSNSEYVCYGVCIPAFGEHGHTDHTLDM